MTTNPTKTMSIMVDNKSTSKGMKSLRRRARGVTLIELMVGLALGMLTTVVIAQALGLAEERRRGTSTGSDVQVNGALATYSLQREIMAAGYGYAVRRDAFGCTARARLNGANVDWPLAPMEIVDGGPNGESDSFFIFSSDKESFAAPMRVTAIHDQVATSYGVNATFGMAVGDYVMAIPSPAGVASDCAVHRVTNVVAGGFDHDADSSSRVPAAGYDVGTTVINLGNLRHRWYAINNETLTERVYNAAVGGYDAATDLYPNVVNMQVFYGLDNAAGVPDDRVDVYNTVQPADAAQWRRVRTVRLVLVTKSGQRERDEVTAVQPTIDLGSFPAVTGSQPCGASQCMTLKVDTDPDWKHYHYKVFSTVIPLRNLLWNVNLS